MATGESGWPFLLSLELEKTVAPQVKTNSESALDTETRLSRLEALLGVQAESIKLKDDRIALLEKRLTDATAKQETVFEKMRRVDEESSLREEARLVVVKKGLERGEHRYEMGMDREPRMTLIVGGNSPEEARGKYLKYFGIRGGNVPYCRETGIAVS